MINPHLPQQLFRNPQPPLRFAGAEDAKKTRPRLLIADMFTQKDVIIDNKLHARTSHGALVEAFARMANPEIETVRIHGKELDFGMVDPCPALRDIISRVDRGERVDAVNFSVGLEVLFSQIQHDMNIPELRTHNVDVYRTYILENLEKLDLDKVVEWRELSEFYTKEEFPGLMREMIGLMEDITERGVPVYTSAGNRGGGNLDLMLLAKGVQGVGAMLNNYKKEHYSGDNAFVTAWALVQHRLAPVLDLSLIHI